MLVLKYGKTGAMRFISHIDLLRHVARIVRRADIPVKFSQGFNPHALLFFSPPIVLGISSVAEYLTIDADIPAPEGFARYNANVPDSLKASGYFECDKNPNLQGKIVAADYVFPVPYIEIPLNKEILITYKKKDEDTVENIADKIYCVFDADGKLGVRLAAGNTNLRADRACIWLEQYVGKICLPDIVKTAQYVFDEGKLVEVDEYLKNFCKQVD